MKLPPNVIATRDRYVSTFPLWTMPGGPEAEERAREWTLGLISQIVHEHPDGKYGSKRADPGRPLSKDAIAQNSSPLLGWDMLMGAGSGSPTLVPNPDAMDITGQIFEPIEGRDVIGGEFPPTEGGGDVAVIPYNEQHAIDFGHGCNQVYVESKAEIDAGMVSVHSQRAAWDYYVGGMTWEESYYKHINEFRVVYGLPPLN